ncbi:L-type lectin-domain containing receptor kinase S.1 [Spatholobus suberectus]|nr:L-type lectin-domain containing receptor kinase S.1 [Spatholobus suberectus]
MCTILGWCCCRCVREEGDRDVGGGGRGEYGEGDMEMVLKLGLACCHPDPQKRPIMKEVVALLLGEDPLEVPKKVLFDMVCDGKELDEVAPLQPSI